MTSEADENRVPDPGRRQLIRRFSAGGAVLVSGTLLGRLGVARAGENPASGYRGLGYSSVHESGGEDLYGSTNEPPRGLGPSALDQHTFPPPLVAGDRHISIDVVEQRIEVAAGVRFDAWAFGGTVPGPIIRATEGDVLTIQLNNRAGHPHSLHFHGAHGPTQDGWEPVPPGGSVTYQIEAGPVGVHPYHCHVPPLAEHVSRGLYGMLIVDPPGGRPPATEVALLLSGFATPEAGPNAVMAWNGVAGFYWRYPIKVPAGQPVRAYVVNMTEYEPVGSFHLHAQTFAVYPAGMGTEPVFRTDVVTMGQAERAMVEFVLPEPGRYMFHPHQHYLAERGAMGWFAAV
ncbi:MAG: multicopper oxidase domain-containing protein [Acidimicrobiia bacterium]